MKRALLLLGIAIVCSNCKKAKDVLYVDTDVTYNQSLATPKFDPGYQLPPEGAYYDYPTMAVATNSKAIREQYEIEKKKITDVNLIGLSFRSISPYGPVFNYIDFVELYIWTKGHGEVLVGYKYNIAKDITKVELVVNSGINVKDYFLADTMYFRLHTHMYGIPPAEKPLNLASTFRIRANPVF